MAGIAQASYIIIYYNIQRQETLKKIMKFALTIPQIDGGFATNHAKQKAANAHLQLLRRLSQLAGALKRSLGLCSRFSAARVRDGHILTARALRVLV